MPLVVPWLAVTCPPFTVTSTPFSVFMTGLDRSIATSVGKEFFSRASSSSGKYSVAVSVGSADDSSMEMSKEANSPLVAELPLPPGMPLPLFHPLFSLLMNSSNGSSAEQQVRMATDVISIVKNKTFFILCFYVSLNSFRCKSKDILSMGKKDSTSSLIYSTKSVNCLVFTS